MCAARGLKQAKKLRPQMVFLIDFFWLRYSCPCVSISTHVVSGCMHLYTCVEARRGYQMASSIALAYSFRAGILPAPGAHSARLEVCKAQQSSHLCPSWRWHVGLVTRVLGSRLQPHDCAASTLDHCSSFVSVTRKSTGQMQLGEERFS